jgi:hypothetical protein
LSAGLDVVVFADESTARTTTISEEGSTDNCTFVHNVVTSPAFNVNLTV